MLLLTEDTAAFPMGRLSHSVRCLGLATSRDQPYSPSAWAWWAFTIFSCDTPA